MTALIFVAAFMALQLALGWMLAHTFALFYCPVHNKRNKYRDVMKDDPIHRYCDGCHGDYARFWRDEDFAKNWRRL